MAAGEVAESRWSKELYGLLSSSFHILIEIDFVIAKTSQGSVVFNCLPWEVNTNNFLQSE